MTTNPTTPDQGDERRAWMHEDDPSRVISDDPQSEAVRHGAKACAELVRALIPQDPDHLAGVGNMVDGKDQSEERHG